MSQGGTLPGIDPQAGLAILGGDLLRSHRLLGLFRDDFNPADAS